MATFEEAKKENKVFKCDHCNELFKASEIVLTDPADNFKILTPGMCFLYIDKNGIITGGNEQPSKEKGDKLLTCPKCNMAHLFGLSLVE